MIVVLERGGEWCRDTTNNIEEDEEKRRNMYRNNQILDNNT